MSAKQASRELSFYFDFISHNAYLAWHQIKGFCAQHELVLKPVPVLFAGFLAANKQLGPAEIASKRNWMLIDVLRKSAQLGIPFNPPASHPFNPLLALRVSIVAEECGKQMAIIDRLFTAIWVDGVDVNDPGALINLIEAEGMDGRGTLNKSSSDAVKATLRSNTDKALSRGVFGVPSMIVDEQLFWGYDDFEFMTLYVNNRDPLDPAVLDRWRKVKPTARRKEHR